MATLISGPRAMSAGYASSIESYLEAFGLSEISMTEATVAIYGTSGRGNRRAVAEIETCVRFGQLQIRGAGRSRMVSRTAQPLPESLYVDNDEARAERIARLRRYGRMA